MLTNDTRDNFATLLDAITLTAADDRPAIITVATGREPQVISRRAFGAAARAVAARLGGLGIGPGDLLVIAHTQNLESIYAFWGALLAGAVPSMFPTLTEKLDPDVYMSSMAELARLSGVAAVLTTDEFAPALRGVVASPVYGSAELAADGAWPTADGRRRTADRRPPAAPIPNSKDLEPTSLRPRSAVGGRPSSSAVAFLQHSSGTTGLQKGVALSHAAVLNQLAAYSDALELKERDVIVSWLPLYHDMGLIAGFLLPLVQGVPLVLMSPFDWVAHPALLLRAIHDHGGTLCWLPNFAYNHCARAIRRRDSEGLSLATMRLFVNCSEPVRHDSHQLFLERFAANGARPEMLGVSYAMAENTFAVTQTPPDRPATIDIVEGASLDSSGYAKPTYWGQVGKRTDGPARMAELDSGERDIPFLSVDYAKSGVGLHQDARALVSCGPPIPGTEVRVRGDDGRPLPDRRVGEIAIRSNCLLTGYYRRPDLQPFDAEGWYLTGDMGYLAEGELYVVGRRKELIINAGKNIYPADIEAVVNDVPGVKVGRAVAFGVADAAEGTELVAVVAETTATDTAERRAIDRAIRREVARRAMVTVSYVHLVGPKWLLKTSSGKIARAANREKWRLEVGQKDLSAD